MIYFHQYYIKMGLLTNPNDEKATIGDVAEVIRRQGENGSASISHIAKTLQISENRAKELADQASGTNNNYRVYRNTSTGNYENRW